MTVECTLCGSHLTTEAVRENVCPRCKMPQGPTLEDHVARSVGAHMTPAEAEVWELIGKAAAAYLKLTETEAAHPMEREEICHSFHDIQARLASRPFLRHIGANS